MALPPGATKGVPQPNQSISTTALVEGDAEGDRLLCVRAMTALYNHHAAIIGGVLTLWEACHV